MSAKRETAAEWWYRVAAQACNLVCAGGEVVCWKESPCCIGVKSHPNEADCWVGMSTDLSSLIQIPREVRRAQTVRMVERRHWQESTTRSQSSR